MSPRLIPQVPNQGLQAAQTSSLLFSPSGFRLFLFLEDVVHFCIFLESNSGIVAWPVRVSVDLISITVVALLRYLFFSSTQAELRKSFCMNTGVCDVHSQNSYTGATGAVFCSLNGEVY